MIFRKYKRSLSLCMASMLSAVLLVFGNPLIDSVLATGNGINVIIMIGDGMGWNMARAGAIAKGAPFYTSGKGSGLSFQNLSGYALVTTYGTTVQGTTSDKPSPQPKLTGNSAVDGSNTLTGASPLRSGFTFDPTFNPGDRLDGNSLAPGNLAGYDISKGGPTPWIPLSPATPGSYDREYIKYSYPDSANTATTLYTGVKSYNNAMGVDIYEQKLKTILEIAKENNKSTGLVTSVPVSHATPGAAASFVNRRNKYDSDYDATKTNQDSILQQILLNFKPNVLLGGGHPLDQANIVNDPNKTGYQPPGTPNYTYIKNSTYNYLKANPTPANRYGYTFLERGPNAAQTLLDTAATIDPNNGGRLFGLYGARGQEGNLPVSSSKGDYSLTGLGNFTLFTSVVKQGKTAANCAAGRLIPSSVTDCIPVLDKANNPIAPNAPVPDTDRPLAAGETDASFIAREVDENPTLSDMANAALTVLGKDPDGFWLMIEGGDIDWAAHDNNMDNLIGTVNDFDRAVQTVMTWINKNGGWTKNLLIVTADHDHYLTINNDFVSNLGINPDPKQSRGLKYNAKAMTFNKHNASEAAHFWGSDPKYKYFWGSHSRRIVPVYYQGAYSSTLTRFLGQGYQMSDSSGTYKIPGVRGVVDQSQIFQTMKIALTGSNT